MIIPEPDWEEMPDGSHTATVWAPNNNDALTLTLAPIDGMLGLFIDGDHIFSVAPPLIDFMLALNPGGILRWVADRQDAQ